MEQVGCTFILNTDSNNLNEARLLLHWVTGCSARDTYIALIGDNGYESHKDSLYLLNIKTILIVCTHPQTSKG